MNDQLPASVQFYDNLETITAMLERRFSLRRIWQKLKDDGKYSGDYTHFCRLAKKEFDGKKQPSNNTRTKKSATPAQERSNESTDINEPESKEDDDDGPLMFMGDLASPHKK